MAKPRPIGEYDYAIALLQKRSAKLLERPPFKDADKERNRKAKIDSYTAALDVLTTNNLPEMGTGGRS